MKPIPSLAELAALQADADLAPAFSLPPLTATHLTELHYAADFFQRAEKAISDELAVLRGTALEIDWLAAQALCFQLLGLALAARMRALRESEGRPA
jgi:hypothetical protein